jgi:general secretion pathway protein H
MRKSRGFTLLELIVVLTMLSFALALVSPYFGRLSKNVELKAAVKKVSTILRYYRSEAVQKGKVYQVVFDTETREIRVRPVEAEEESGEEPDSGSPNSGEKEKYRVPDGIHVKEIKIPSSQYPSEFPVIEFYPNGGSNGGSFVMDRDDAKGYRIQVHFLTGIVEIKEG